MIATVSNPPVPSVPAVAPLSPEHLQQLAEARTRLKLIRRAITVAKFDAWTIAIFGGLTFLGSLIDFGFVGIALGMGMCAAAFIEFRSVKRLQQLDVEAPRVLAMNQIFLGGLLLAYAMISLWKIFHGGGEISQALARQAEVAGMLGDVPSMERGLGLLVYGTLACVAIFGQGGTAWFYHSRRKYVEAYLRDTPKWIIEAQRAGLSL